MQIDFWKLGSEHFVTIVSDEDGVFAVATDTAVFHADGPVARFVDIVGGFAEARHGFDANSVAFNEFVTATFLAIVWNFGKFVHRFAKTMADVVFEDAEVVFAEDLFDGMTNVANVGAWSHLLDSLPHGGLGDFDHFLDGWATFTTD